MSALPREHSRNKSDSYSIIRFVQIDAQYLLVHDTPCEKNLTATPVTLLYISAAQWPFYSPQEQGELIVDVDAY